MNNRVLELAQQAGFSTWVLNPSKETSSDIPKQLEKFAELIVNECLELNAGELAYPKWLDLKIIYKEHFGVQE